MAQGKLQLKFESNPCSYFRDNRCHRQMMDGRRMTTTDEFRFHYLCWHSQAELKIWKILNSKFQKYKTTFVRTIEKKIQKNLKIFRRDFREGYRFEIFAPKVSHVNENEKNKQIVKLWISFVHFFSKSRKNVWHYDPLRAKRTNYKVPYYNLYWHSLAELKMRKFKFLF